MGVCQPLFQTFCPCELPCEGSPLCPCAPVDARRVPCRTETPSRRWADPAGTAIESEQSTDLNPSGGEHQPTVRPPSSCPCSSGAPLVPLRCSWRALSQAEPCHLVDQPGAANPKLGPHPPDRPLLLDVAGLQVAEKISEAKLGQPRRPPSLPTDRLDLASPLARGDLPGGPPVTLNACLLHQAPHRGAMRAQLGGDLGQQPLPSDQAVLQVGPHVGEPQPGHPRGDPLLGVAASLLCQPLRPGWQCDVLGGECLGDGPVADAQFSGERGDAVAGVAAALEIAAQVREPEQAGAPLQPPDAATIDHKPALEDQLPRRLRW